MNIENILRIAIMILAATVIVLSVALLLFQLVELSIKIKRLIK